MLQRSYRTMVEKYNEMAVADLYIKEKELKSEVVKLRIKHTAAQLEDTSVISKAKKEIAKIKTVISAKEMEA